MGIHCLQLLNFELGGSACVNDDAFGELAASGTDITDKAEAAAEHAVSYPQLVHWELWEQYLLQVAWRTQCF